jgi:hypothetical protein
MDTPPLVEPTTASGTKHHIVRQNRSNHSPRCSWRFLSFEMSVSLLYQSLDQIQVASKSTACRLHVSMCQFPIDDCKREVRPLQIHLMHLFHLLTFFNSIHCRIGARYHAHCSDCCNQHSGHSKLQFRTLPLLMRRMSPPVYASERIVEVVIRQVAEDGDHRFHSQQCAGRTRASRVFRASPQPAALLRIPQTHLRIRRKDIRPTL